MDAQHKDLFHRASIVLEKIKDGAACGEISPAMEALVNATMEHFKAEEDLLKKEVYPLLDVHCCSHKKLFAELLEMNLRIHSGEAVSCQEFHNFFLSWIVFHILSEDLGYAKFIEESDDFLI
jgi:hemerythrin-like metal-binding protein